MAERPRLHKIDAEMRRWCVLLEEEVSGWPDVTSRPMFGMNGYYRGQAIFAAIPRTRAAGNAFSLLVKLPASKAGTTTTRGLPGAGWVAVEMRAEDDIAVALTKLGQAYEQARKSASR